jgi:putative acetyltransferase
LEIRRSIESDIAAILQAERHAFGDAEGPEIAELVKELLNDPSAMPLLSLLALNDGNAVGHILFTRTRLSSSSESVSTSILAPLAVIPEAQSQGIGSVTGKVFCADALNKPEYWRE